MDTEEVFARPYFLELIRQNDETAYSFAKKAVPCSAAGMKKSSLFGEPNGTRLQISAFQCGFQVVEMTVPKNGSSQPPSSIKYTDYELSLVQKIIINGLPISLETLIEENISSWNLYFNEWAVDVPGVVSAPEPKDLLLEQEDPIHLPEGSFKFVVSNCKIVRETEDEDPILTNRG